MTEQLFSQQLESPSGTGRVATPKVKPACQLPPPTNGMPTGQPILTGRSGASAARELETALVTGSLGGLPYLNPGRVEAMSA